MTDYIIAPSILSANFAKLGEEVEQMLAAGTDWVHFDVMDNHYVPNLTVGPMVCQALRDHGITAPIDVHLMVEPVDELIPAFAQAGASMISVHPESTKHLHRTISLIKSLGCQAGIALNPATPIETLYYIMDDIDLVLLMSVNPGFGGQSFIPSTLYKCAEVADLIEQSGANVRIQVDGGVNAGNIAEIADAGADTFVVGSALYNKDDYPAAVTELRKQLASV